MAVALAHAAALNQTLDRVRAELAARRREAERATLEADAEAVRERCKTLYGFVREAWRVLEPNEPFVDGWHIEAICLHLEAVSYGQIQNLLINVPPGSMKSLLVSVMWPAWEWGPFGRPDLTYMSGSYEQTLAWRDNGRMKRLVESEWYQHHWPLPLTKRGEKLFANAQGGERRARAFNSMTGGRAKRVIIDDPHSTTTAESDETRAQTIKTFREALPDRVSNPETDPIVIIMQRLHSKDVSGTILELGLDYVHLRIPMEYEADNPCRTVIGWKDPRKRDGELMCPARWSKKVIAKLKHAKGSYAWSGQYQQRPVPREGGLFKREYFAGRIVKAIPRGTFLVRHWDLAATELKATDTRGARTAGVKLGKTPDGRYIIADLKVAAYEGAKVRKLIKAIAETDGKGVHIQVPQDPGQSGKTQSKDLVAMLDGWVVHRLRETGDKVTRAEPIAVQAEAGNVDILQGDWNEEFLTELCLFPGGPRKDIADALSGAHSYLIAAPKPNRSFGAPVIIGGE